MQAYNCFIQDKSLNRTVSLVLSLACPHDLIRKNTSEILILQIGRDRRCVSVKTSSTLNLQRQLTWYGRQRQRYPSKDKNVLHPSIILPDVNDVNVKTDRDKTSCKSVRWREKMAFFSQQKMVRAWRKKNLDEVCVNIWTAAASSLSVTSKQRLARVLETKIRLSTRNWKKAKKERKKSVGCIYKCDYNCLTRGFNLKKVSLPRHDKGIIRFGIILQGPTMPRPAPAPLQASAWCWEIPHRTCDQQAPA